MGTASSGEWIAILLYFALVIGVGVYFFFRDRHQEGEKEYFLGGRSGFFSYSDPVWIGVPALAAGDYPYHGKEEQ